MQKRNNVNLEKVLKLQPCNMETSRKVCSHALAPQPFEVLLAFRTLKGEKKKETETTRPWGAPCRRIISARLGEVPFKRLLWWHFFSSLVSWKWRDGIKSGRVGVTKPRRPQTEPPTLPRLRERAPAAEPRWRNESLRDPMRSERKMLDSFSFWHWNLTLIIRPWFMCSPASWPAIFTGFGLFDVISLIHSTRDISHSVFTLINGSKV